jgi:transcriptional regulator with XRE-family HTH domain
VGAERDARVLLALLPAAARAGRDRLLVDERARHAAGGHPELAPPELVARVAGSLRAVRHARELSQHDLADLAGVTPSAISQVERAERGLSLATVVRLAGALGVTIDDLVRGEEQASYRIGRRTDDPGRGLIDSLGLLDEPHIDLVHLDAREKADAPPAPAGSAIVAVASGLVQVRLGTHTPALRHGEVLVADSGQVEGFRNLGQTEALLFWIVYA